VLVVLVFAVLWLPIHVHLLVAFFGHIPTDSPVYMTLSVVWNCLAYANSCVNPIIYNYTCNDFREAFRSVVHGCCPFGSVIDEPMSWKYCANAGAVHLETSPRQRP